MFRSGSSLGLASAPDRRIWCSEVAPNAGMFPAPVGDQPLEVKHDPHATSRAETRELVIV
jgi:hypothetical protein